MSTTLDSALVAELAGRVSGPVLGPQDAHSAFRRRRARCGDQRRLADPGRPFDHHERAAPGPSLGQRRFDAGQLPAALEQLSDAGR